MKYVKNFYSLSDAKRAVILSPTVIFITCVEERKPIVKKTGIASDVLEIVGDTIDDVDIVVKKIIKNNEIWYTTNDGNITKTTNDSGI